MDGELKLYRVTLRGMTYNSTSMVHGISYVVAQNSDEAYLKVKNFLDTKDIGYKKDRELDKVELLASTYQYNNIGFMLYI